MSHSKPAEYQRPFLKWAGNKFQLLSTLQKLLPSGQRFIEPFAGSGVVFLNSDYPRYVLNDKNIVLITLYKMLKKFGDEFIAATQHYFQPRYNDKEVYYQLRDRFNQCDDPFDRSILFMYLNRHGYNGLCRFNSKGHYNVPFGKYKLPTLPIETMRLFHQRSKLCRFCSKDFSLIMQQARTGDVIYCDPPYVPLSATAHFTSYWGVFDEACHQHLAEEAKRCAERGIPVLISNHDTAFTRQLYQDADTIKQVRVQRHISCQVENRNKARELLVLYK